LTRIRVKNVNVKTDFQRLSPDLEEFRLGVQKCRKTIRDGVRNELVFHGKGIEAIFHFLRKLADTRSGGNRYSSSKITSSDDVKLVIKCMVKLSDNNNNNNNKKPKRSTSTSNRLQQKQKTSTATSNGFQQKPKTDPDYNKMSNLKKSVQFGSEEATSVSEISSSTNCCQRRGVGPHIDEKIRVVRRRCREKCRNALSGDRLLEDKLYLKTLATGIDDKPGTDVDWVI
jgi:hypothetical protein